METRVKTAESNLPGVAHGPRSPEVSVHELIEQPAWPDDFDVNHSDLLGRLPAGREPVTFLGKVTASTLLRARRDWRHQRSVIAAELVVFCGCTKSKDGANLSSTIRIAA